jgi:site-specific recombinase XerC
VHRRPAALPTGQNDPLFERPDLTQDDYYRLRHPSRLTAPRRLESFARQLEANGRARATVTRRLSTIAGFYKYAVVTPGGRAHLAPGAPCLAGRDAQPLPAISSDPRRVTKGCPPREP